MMSKYFKATSKSGHQEATQAPAAPSPPTIYCQQTHVPRRFPKRVSERTTRSTLISLVGVRHFTPPVPSEIPALLLQ